MPTYCQNGKRHKNNTDIPIEPPIAIICKCLLLSLRARGEFAVLAAALSGSKTRPSPPSTPFGVTDRVGSRLKLSTTRFRPALLDYCCLLVAGFASNAAVVVWRRCLVRVEDGPLLHIILVHGGGGLAHYPQIQVFASILVIVSPANTSIEENVEGSSFEEVGGVNS